MDTIDLVVVPGQPTQGLRVVVCGNAEVLSGHDEFCPSKDDMGDIVDRAIRAIEKAGGSVESIQSFFADWNGGKFSGRNLGYGSIFISLFEREIEVEEKTDADGFTEAAEYGDWSWSPDSSATPEAVALAGRLAEAGNQAMDQALADAAARE